MKKSMKTLMRNGEEENASVDKNVERKNSTKKI